MNQLSTADRARVLACLVEGNSQRATVRMTGIAKGTVAKLAVEIGRACEIFAEIPFSCLHSSANSYRTTGRQPPVTG